VVLTILPAIKPRPSPGETGGFETIAPLDSAMEYRAGELAADRIIHMMGTLAGAVGSAILVGIAAAVAVQPTFSASLVYSVCLVAMLGCSAAYHLASNASRRAFLRQLDHAAIFLMIAGTYTPFTTCRLHGVWAIGMTAAVWTGAVTGAVMKLICPHRVDRVSIVAYLALGWIILVGMRPMLSSVDIQTAVLIGVGGVLYSIGTGFHLWRALPFHNAIWHSFVLIAASCHYAAVLHGVVLARS
jgi:hemolysin III